MAMSSALKTHKNKISVRLLVETKETLIKKIVIITTDIHANM